MPGRRLRWPAILLACALLAGCGGSTQRERDVEPPAERRAGEATATVAETAATTGAAETPARTELAGRLARGMPAACRRDLATLDGVHGRAAARAAKAIAARKQAAAKLERLKKELAAAKERMNAADRAYQDANAPLAAFLEANPDQYLDSEAFAEYERLKRASDEAAGPYREAVRAHNDLVAEHNDVVARFNKLTNEVNALARAAHRRQGRFRALAERCLPAVDDWRSAVAPLEQRLAAPAMAAFPDAPFAEVRCDAPGEWNDAERDDPAPATFERAGYVIEGEPTIHLAPRACLALDMLLSRAAPTLACVPREVAQRFAACTPSRGEAAVALATLAHEAQHVAGVSNEAEAECYGIQTVDDVARALGLPEKTAAALGTFTRRRVSLPAEYRSDACKPGGALDLEPDTPAFP